MTAAAFCFILACIVFGPEAVAAMGVLRDVLEGGTELDVDM